MSKLVIIFGCGAQSKYVLDNLCSNFKSLNHDLVWVDIENKQNPISISQNQKIMGINDALSLLKKKKASCVIAHGDNKLKENIFKKLNSYKIDYENFVHANSSISTTAKIGKGNIINTNSVILPNSIIGSHNIFHSGSVIEHDCIIDDFVNIGPGVVLAGRVEVGKRSYIFTGSKVAPRVKIGDDVTVGAGSLVLNDIPSGMTVYGSPAKGKKK